MKKQIILLGACVAMLLSCKPSPKNYQVEIDDAVKYYLSCGPIIAAHLDQAAEQNAIFSLNQEFLGGYGDTHSEEGFRYMLSGKAADGDTLAAEWLDIYHSTELDIAEYTKMDDDTTWIFLEKNSNVHFIFTLTEPSFLSYHFSLRPDEDDYDSYMLRIMGIDPSELEDEECNE